MVRTFDGPDVLPVTQPVSKHWRRHEALSQPVAWPHPFFIHHVPTVEIRKSHQNWSSKLPSTHLTGRTNMKKNVATANIWKMTQWHNGSMTIFQVNLVWCCWLGITQSIQPVKNWVMRCWRGYLSGVRCKWFVSSWCYCHPIISCFKSRSV